MSSPNQKKAIFVFPAASGHINPSLPLARGLVNSGWSVDYLASTEFKDAIIHTGATFCNRDSIFRSAGIEDVTAMVKATAADYGDPVPQWWLNFGSISTASMLPVYIDWFRSRDPHLIVYCPVLCQVALFASFQLKIPAVSLLTTSGPGYFDAAIAAMAGAVAVRGVAEGLARSVAAVEKNATAIESIKSQLAMPELTLNTAEPLCRDYYTGTNLVSTTEELADPMCAADAEYYKKAGKRFFFVGPLLDTVSTPPNGKGGEVMRRVEAAAAANQPVVYVSMGTVVTSDNEEHGWNGTSGSGITGKQLCQSVYRAVFEELGGEEEEVLIVVSLGNQPKALEGVMVPPNAVCAASVPQIELLRVATPTLFVTNGGQNSLMESMTVGTPVLVCPGFGDQVANAAKVTVCGWGDKVDRPPAQVGTDQLPAYQKRVQRGVRAVLDSPNYAAHAKLIAAGLERAVGVDGALRILIEAAN
jgi:UDP:flavonoid glycosyltransferase YjiC (YdhE family)